MLNCTELCEHIGNAHRIFKESALPKTEAYKKLKEEIEVILKNFTTDSNMELQKKNKRQQDCMNEAITAIEEVLGELDNFPPAHRPGIAIFRLQDTRSNLIISM